MRKRLQLPEDTLLQFAPKGSYRLPNMLQYLDFAFRPAPHPSQTLVFMLDWYAVHLDGEIDRKLHEMGHAILRIGGGITGDVQVGDTHRHGPYTKAYRDREQDGAIRQQNLRPGRMPEVSRQTVLDRAVGAWRDLDHSHGRREWVEDGFLNALDGSEDAALRRDLYPLWLDLDMPAERERIIREVEGRVRSGELTQWSQYPLLLEPYDDHEGLREGEEAAAQVVHDAPEDDTDANPEEDAPSGILREAAKCDEPRAQASRHGGSCADATASRRGGSCVDPTDTQRLLPQDLEERARADLAKDAPGERMLALAKSIELLRDKDDRASEWLQARLANLQRKSDRVTDETALWLRSKRLERRDQDVAARAAAAAEDRESDRLAAELKLAKAKLEEARAVSGAQRAEAKRACLELRARLDVTKREAEREKQRRELLRKRFVDWKLGQAKAWFQDSKLGEGRRQALREAFTRRRPEEKRIPAAPEPWANSERDGYIELTPGYLTLGKPKRDQLDLASDALARRLFGGRHPLEAKSGMTPQDRCKAMLHACLPHFGDHFPHFMQVVHTIRKPHRGNFDLALFEILWRFSHSVPPALWPGALRKWPLPPAEMNEFLREMGREDLELPRPALKVAAASSSRSGASPPVLPPAASAGAEVFAVPAHAKTAATAAAVAAFAAEMAKGKTPPPPPRDAVPPRPPPRAKAGPKSAWEEKWADAP